MFRSNYFVDRFYFVLNTPFNASALGYNDFVSEEEIWVYDFLPIFADVEIFWEGRMFTLLDIFFCFLKLRNIYLQGLFFGKNFPKCFYP